MIQLLPFRWMPRASDIVTPGDVQLSFIWVEEMPVTPVWVLEEDSVGG